MKLKYFWGLCVEIFRNIKTIILLSIAILMTKETYISFYKEYILSKFHKYITCKLGTHRYILSYQPTWGAHRCYHCERCYREINEEQYDFIIRRIKIKRLKK